MAKNDLTAQRLRELLHYDPETGVFTRRVSTSSNAKAGAVAGSNDGKGYLRIWIDSCPYLAHRLAWVYVHGVQPTNHIDHIDGNPANNRIENLRDVSIGVNQQNRHTAQKNNKLGILGVKRHGKKFLAQITVDGKRRSIGTFPSYEQAHSAYLIAKRQFHEGCTI